MPAERATALAVAVPPFPDNVPPLLAPPVDPVADAPDVAAPAVFTASTVLSALPPRVGAAPVGPPSPPAPPLAAVVRVSPMALAMLFVRESELRASPAAPGAP